MRLLLQKEKGIWLVMQKYTSLEFSFSNKKLFLLFFSIYLFVCLFFTLPVLCLTSHVHISDHFVHIRIISRGLNKSIVFKIVLLQELDLDLGTFLKKKKNNLHPHTSSLMSAAVAAAYSRDTEQ